jgi:DNA-binding helix-hairpin-helix protein with protein kinase domain
VRFQRATTGEVVALEERHKLGAGGEARIFVWPADESLVAKIWHKPTLERNRKLRVMLANPPADPMAGQQHHSIAWPGDLLHLPARPEHLVGFLMPRVVGMRPVGEFAHPRTRREKCPLFNWFYLHRTARNLATALRAIHERGYVVGDLNESNVLVAETALVTLVDTDSFQVWDAEAGRMYRCRVGKPEYTPPELQGKRFPDVDRLPEHDRFGLGVLLFQLLLEGTHPFAGVFQGRGEPPMLEQRIAAGHFVFAGDPRVPYRPSPAAPSFELLFPGLRDLFQRCFVDGHFRPALRPDPQSWQWMLEEAETHLVSCWANAQHVYGDHLPQCPWCARAQLLGGRDPFPSPEAVRAGEHLQPPPRASPAWPGRGQTASTSRRPVPTPPPIPPSGSQTATRGARAKGRPRPLLGDWNDWAWVAVFFAGLTIVVNYQLGRWGNPVSFLLGLLALLTGIVGEAKAQTPEIDGRGRWLARTAIVVGLINVLWRMFSGP